MSTIKTRKLGFGERRGVYVNVNDFLHEADYVPRSDVVGELEDLDLLYRTLCGILYNFVPTSGHPGGSISSGRIVESLIYQTMNYDMGDPDNSAADILAYAAGHKAMGLYAMWALRNEVLRQYNESLLPKDVRKQLRLEDLLGFRRNPTQRTPLFQKFEAKPLDGHPSPLVPFVKISTGASGVGVPTALGLGLGARDYYGDNSPFVHILEGEGGLTPGRVAEAMATAGTSQVNNVVLHIDWNQSSIDSDRVCREDAQPGDYVQWDPMEYAYLHDWNVIQVPNGFDFEQVLAAQKLAAERINGQPTCIVYRTVKGWRYGIEGRGSHGAGHKFCSDEFYAMLQPVEERFGVEFPRFSGEKSEDEKVEALYYENLLTLRSILEKHKSIVQTLGGALEQSAERLTALKRESRKGAPDVGKLYTSQPEKIPAELLVDEGEKYTLRGELGKVLGYLNKQSNGAILAAAADLLGSTSISMVNDGFAEGFWNAQRNPESRLLAIGGICEDAMGGVMAGVSTFGKSIGAASSYGAFIAALQHVPARLHCIGQQAKQDYNDEPHNPYFLICAHAGLKTGEDGPTHADPQALQLLQENFPKGSMITLTPWEPNEIWPLVVAALNHRPSVIAPFVTRPTETILDRKAFKLPPLELAAKGVYAIRTADSSQKPYHGTVIIQGSGEMNAFVSEVLPKIDEEKLNINVLYVASQELFELLPQPEQEKIFPIEMRQEAMGITGFTLPTLYRWLEYEEGHQRSLHPYMEGRFPGSGQASKVLEEAHLDGAAQWKAVSAYAEWKASKA